MKFSSEFKCLGADCPKTCCSGEIKLSMIDLIRFKPRFKQGHYFVDGIKVKIYFDQRSGLPYGLLSIDGELCPLLKNGLCSRYNDRPLVCRAYPYMIYYPEVSELELNSGCKGIKTHQWGYVSKSDVAPIIEEFKDQDLIAQLLKQRDMKELADLAVKGKLLDLVVSFLK